MPSKRFRALCKLFTMQSYEISRVFVWLIEFAIFSHIIFLQYVDTQHVVVNGIENCNLQFAIFCPPCLLNVLIHNRLARKTKKNCKLQIANSFFVTLSISKLLII